MNTTAIATDTHLVSCPWCENSDVVVTKFAKQGSISICGQCFQPAVFVCRTRLKRLSNEEYRAMPVNIRLKMLGIIDHLRRDYERRIARN